MKEILAENLQPLFDNTSLHGECTYKGELYEVWEVSDENFKIMCDMTDSVFEKVCPDSMWRSSNGSIFEHPYEKQIVNNHEMIAWSANFFDCEKSRRKRKYSTLLEYLCEAARASTPKNVCALAVDLAKANNMKMSELFKTYEG